MAAIQKGGSAAVDASGVANGQDPRIVQVGGTGGTQTRYVAISHVWSDGLGNPWSNRLCSSQLNHIQALVNGLYPLDQAPVPFWIDSLGIPVGRRHVRDRQVAITRIHQTFSQADKVLVLNNYLKSCDNNAPLVEKLIRLQYSPWMTRVWTLLEGNIARNLHFQFADKAVSSDYLIGPAARQSFQVVSKFLRELPDERLWSCPSAMQLIRAFALGSAMPKHLSNYASLPEQSDSGEEELRQTAIQLLEQNAYVYALGKEWRQFLFQSGKVSNLLDCEENAHVLTDVGTKVTCPVLTHGLNSIGSMRGVAIQEYHRDRRDMDSGCFTEACGGFRSRTTSRLDDVTREILAALGEKVGHQYSAMDQLVSSQADESFLVQGGKVPNVHHFLECAEITGAHLGTAIALASRHGRILSPSYFFRRPQWLSTKAFPKQYIPTNRFNTLDKLSPLRRNTSDKPFVSSTG
ncbi:hypothetical protein K456DRAFT_44103 [Colletotrichum gloeosporioides 23]|nr:hypothetical protein K456DRAFT_44103 [Colletotrichum gloeosporioides 23]